MSPFAMTVHQGWDQHDNLPNAIREQANETDQASWHEFHPDAVHVHDLQATILRLMGIDHERLFYKFQGRRYRLTDVHGPIVDDLIA